MTTLRLDTLTMPAAELGPENPLPPLSVSQELHLAQSADSAIPDDMRRNMSYGHLPNLLPYTMQDGYNREKSPRDFRVAVLENDLLRATFLLEYGGRLWSLYHKPSGRELLSVNPVFQPANLALRHAWFSGGVEWNIGTIGHTPFTCSPLFAARVEGPGGLPVLRMYEWERIRQVTYQIDAWLPGDSPVLLVRVCITNPRDCDVPMYWWSNIAVPETPDTRVLVPATSAYRYSYDHLDIIPVPENGGLDITYAAKVKHATDFFFHITEKRLPWITALDGKGRGLFQVSTNLLQGRKLFVWGMGRGGRKWQEFLSVPGQAYIEIQAGLARTQLEHLPMPPLARWDWLEAYGLLETDPNIVHGSEWEQATETTAAAIEKLVPRHKLETELARSLAWRDQPPTEILQHGSGWGALEQIRRSAMSEPLLCSPGLIFDETSLGPQQMPWVALLENGEFPLSADTTPMGTLVQDEWLLLLEKSAHLDQNWLALLHLGLMRHYRGDFFGARQAWEASLRIERTPWTLRNLAILDQQEGHTAEAAEKYIQAFHLKSDLLPLVMECGKFLVEAGHTTRWLELLAELPATLRQHGRIHLLEAQATLALGQLERAGQLIESLSVIADLREGELSLSQLWENYQVQRLSALENRPVDKNLRARARQLFPLPESFDFRMTAND